MLPHIFKNIQTNANRLALVENAKNFSYNELNKSSDSIALELEKTFGLLIGKRIILLISPGFNYVAALFAIWKLRAVAVPVFIDLPAEALAYYVSDSGSEILLTDDKRINDLESLQGQVNIIDVATISIENNQSFITKVEYDDNALIIYTSGTTSKPKGVLTTHRILEAQILSLVKAWEWSEADSILNVLPLHHVHGLVNALLCPLFSGAKIYILPKFDSTKVWEILCSGQINVFMAVPTIYAKLISDFETAMDMEKLKRTEQLRNFRLMVSGSAALPVSILEKWKSISHHFLLERYGMTEIGMALSNPYKGERKAGFVGLPLPAVQVRLFDNDKGKLAENEDSGEIQIKSPAVFKGYWNRETATAESFTADGWFKTGDLAVCIDGYFKILGRLSSDIIKSGGYKLSAIEIEETLREYPLLADCAVLGIPDETWGEIVVAVLVLKDKKLDVDTKLLSECLAGKMPSYKIPKKYRIVVDLPRNAMGKVVKNSLKELF